MWWQGNTHRNMLQSLLLSAVHTRHTHPAHRAADVSLTDCRYNNSRCKQCYPGNITDGWEHSSGDTPSNDRLYLSQCLPPHPLHSLLVPARAAAVRAVDGGGGREALHPPGARGGMSSCPGVSVLRPVVHGGGSRRASGARVRVDLHACGPSAGRQQVS